MRTRDRNRRSGIPLHHPEGLHLLHSVGNWLRTGWRCSCRSTTGPLHEMSCSIVRPPPPSGTEGRTLRQAGQGGTVVVRNCAAVAWHRSKSFSGAPRQIRTPLLIKTTNTITKPIYSDVFVIQQRFLSRLAPFCCHKSTSQSDLLFRFGSVWGQCWSAGGSATTRNWMTN